MCEEDSKLCAKSEGCSLRRDIICTEYWESTNSLSSQSSKTRPTLPYRIHIWMVSPQHSYSDTYQMLNRKCQVSEWVIKFNGFSRTADSEVHHSKNKVVKWTTLGLSNWCQKRTPQSRPKLVIWVSRRMTTLMSSQKQPESRQMTTFFTGFSAIWRLSYHLGTTEWQTSNRQMMVLWLICDKS